MTTGSLRLRLVAVSAVAISVALFVAGLVLQSLFVQHVRSRAEAELQTQLRGLASAIAVSPTGLLQLAREPVDPRFDTPYSGLYWQAAGGNGAALRSRSLWDTSLPLPVDELVTGETHRHEIDGPRGTRLLALERTVTIDEAHRPVPVRLAVAVDLRELDHAASGFRSVVAASLVILGALLIGAFWIQIGIGLKPFDHLARSVADVRADNAKTVEGRFPDEVAPLVAEFNRVLELHREGLERARHRAGDLAHGFKTPLSVLAACARDLHRAGEKPMAEEIEAQVGRMRAHVNRELARARSAAMGGRSRGITRAEPVLRRIAGALERIDERGITIAIDAAGVDFPGDPEDLLELAGNLLDNACKWARARVDVMASSDRERFTLVIDDDGPGIAHDDGPIALVRGAKLDEAVPGSGLGLAIVSDLAQAHGGTVSLSRSPMGGLRAQVTIPAGS